ncbi:hypothetical protein FHX09_005965 [Rhizobium sp. BK538]|nr:hypothetical protein [Rhizobium sp. BK538]
MPRAKAPLRIWRIAHCLLLMLTVLGLRIDMPDVAMLPVFWIKSSYHALIALAAFLAVYRLSPPDGTEDAFSVGLP